MVDTFDLFRKLSSGANFDRERYRKDTALIQVLQTSTCLTALTYEVLLKAPFRDIIKRQYFIARFLGSLWYNLSYHRQYILHTIYSSPT